MVMKDCRLGVYDQFRLVVSVRMTPSNCNQASNLSYVAAMNSSIDLITISTLPQPSPNPAGGLRPMWT